MVAPSRRAPTPMFTTVQVEEAEDIPPSLRDDTDETEPPKVGEVGGE